MLLETHTYSRFHFLSSDVFLTLEWVLHRCDNKFLPPQQQKKRKEKQTNRGVSLFLGQSNQSMGAEKERGTKIFS
jgi:hypothetical protein